MTNTLIRLYAQMKWTLARACSGMVTGPPAGHGELEARLLSRHAFPSARWKKSGLPVDFVRPVLGLLQEHAVWPNDFFDPDDLIAPFLIRSSYPHAGEEFLLILWKKYGVEYTYAEKQTISEQAWTMKDFVADLFNRSQGL